MSIFCDQLITISGSGVSLELIHNKFLDLNYIQIGDYPNFFNSDDLGDYENEWQRIFDIDYSGDNITINTESLNEPTRVFWMGISKEYNTLVTLEYKTFITEKAGILCWTNGIEIENKEINFWRFLYEYYNDVFWKELFSKSNYTSFDNLILSLRDIYVDLSLPERERVKEIHSNNYVKNH